MSTVTGLKLSPSSRSYWGLIVNGISYNFEDLGFLIKSYTGAGLPALSNNTLPYGTRGWETYQGTNVSPRPYILVGVIEGDSLKDITQKRQVLISLLAPISGIAPLVNLTFQLIDQYGSAVGKKLQVPVHYAGGLEGNVDNVWDEPIALTFTEHAPSQIVESVVNTATFPQGPIVPGLSSSLPNVQVRVNGVWTQPFSASSGPFYGLEYDASGDLWVGTNGTILRRSGMPYAEHLALSNPVRVMHLGIDGNMYAAGTGGKPERKIAATGLWQSIGDTTFVGTVYDMLLVPGSSPGTYVLIVVGNFTSPGTRVATINFSGDTANSGAWSTYSANDTVYTVARHPSGDLYFGGYFTVFNTYTCAGIIKQPVSGPDVPVGSGVPATYGVHKINVLTDGRLLISGAFPSIGGKTAFHQAYWDGYSYEAVPGTNPNNFSDLSNNVIQNTIIDPTTGNYLTTSSGNDAIFNGVDWTWSDVWFFYRAMDMTYRSDGELAISFSGDTTVSANILSGGLTINNTSTHEVWPQIKIVGSIAVQSIFNYTTGKQISFKGGGNVVGSGGIITMQCGGPAGVSLTSNLFGDITNSIAYGSNIGDFNLRPGINYLGALLTSTPDANNYVQISYQNQHWTFDAATIGA